MNRSPTTICLAVLVLLMLPACARQEQPEVSSTLEEFSQEWQPASLQERGLLLQKWLPDAVAWHLRGKTREQVLSLLGTPDKMDPAVVDENTPAQAQFMLYKCGNLNGPYNWAIIVTINYEGKVVACKMQQDTSEETETGAERKPGGNGKGETFNKIELLPSEEEPPPAKKETPPEGTPKAPAK
jgi:hypothetical protein